MLMFNITVMKNEGFKSMKVNLQLQLDYSSIYTVNNIDTSVSFLVSLRLENN